MKVVKEIKQVDINKLNPAEYNPRELTKKQYKDLKKSIEKFGMVEPVVVNENKDRKNIIVGGHQRYYICKEAGWDKMPVVYVNLELEDERELNLRLNKNLGQWDWDKLAGFDEEELLNVGFDEDGIREIFQLDIEEDSAPDLPESEPDSKRGEIYELGRHRLMCGDATDIEDVERLMGGKKADMVFTDPPYGVSYADKNEFLNEYDKGNRIQDNIERDHDSLEDVSKLWRESFSNIRVVLKGGGSYYITGPQGGDLHLMMMMMMKEADLPLRHQLIWVKNNHVLGRTDYNYKHEPILYGWLGSHRFYGGGSQRFSVWNFDKPVSSKLHPTMKPVGLVANAVKNSSKEDDIILDLFGGSGSTLIACEQTNRTCYMMEIDPRYCDVIRERYDKLVNRDEI